MTYLPQAVEASLRRLGVNTHDVLLLHSPSTGFDWSTYDLKPFDDLIQTGKPRSYGVGSRSI